MQYSENRINSPAVEAVAICQLDRSDSSLGTLGKSGYNACYLSCVATAGAAVSRDLDRGFSPSIPSVGLNLKALGSSAEEVQAAGVSLGGQGRAFGFTDTSDGQLGPAEVRQIEKESAGQQDSAPQAVSRDPAVLADNPAHADHSTYQQIHTWVRGTGSWTDEESKNVAASLYRQQVDDPLIRRIDAVTSGVGKDGAHNVFAVYAPHGMDKGSLFHAHIDGRQASQEPAQQSLQQAEALQQSQSRQHALKQAQQQAQQQEQAPKISMAGHDEALGLELSSETDTP